MSREFPTISSADAQARIEARRAEAKRIESAMMALPTGAGTSRRRFDDEQFRFNAHGCVMGMAASYRNTPKHW